MCANLESELIVGKNVVRIEAVEVQELGAVVVDDGAEAESAPPAGRHVQDVDPGVTLRSTSCAFGSGREEILTKLTGPYSFEIQKIKYLS
jgi:hypothetical protein